VADPVLLSARAGAVLTLTLNRPGARNALNLALIEALNDALDGADADGGIAAVVLAGNDKAFCAGADLKEFAGAGADAALQRRRSDGMARLFARPEKMATPVIAAIDGFALGGGCALALGCDMAVASPAARFGYPEIRVGMVPVGVVPALVRRVGRAAAFDLVATGRAVGADEALRLGIVQRLAGPDGAVAEAVAIAGTLAEHGAGAVATAKRLVRDLAAAATAEDENAAVARARAEIAKTNQTGESAS